jgi:nicotinamide-nucleotide amidase
MLLKEGYSVARHLALPDDPEVLLQLFTTLSTQSVIVIATGGLGPTGDDKTRAFLDDLAKLTGFEEIEIPNPIGTAQGVCLKGKASCLIALPGVPFEMAAMMPWVMSFLRERFSPQYQLDHGWVYFMRMSEMKVDPFIHELIKRYPDLSYGIYPSQGVLGVHLQAPQGSNSLVLALEALKAEFHYRLIECPMGTGKLEEAVFHRFTEKKLTLATAESCTGGTIAAKLVSIPGASNYFLGGVITYSNEMKTSLLGVDAELLEKEGAVSEAVVKAMARGIQERSGADYAAAVSGIAGPGGGTPEKPVGTVWYAIATHDDIKTWCRLIPGNRELIIERTANFLLSELLLELAAT